MIYFKHSELVDEYRVSLKTVHNWIDAAKQGKVDLRLHQENGKTYIANSPDNIAALKKLADKGKKYRNTLHQKVVTPQPEFYELYSQRQILDIISNLTIHREIPRQYNYMDGGAKSWDDWVNRLQIEEEANILKGTQELLHANLGSLDLLLQGGKRVNIIDLGVGNALPVKELLSHLLEMGMLHRYIGIDISEDMLRIAEKNIDEWFDGKVRFEGYVRDISYERFDDLLVSDSLNNDTGEVINLVLLLGGTPMNFRSPQDVLNVIYGSMGEHDLLAYTDKPDTEASRRYFDFNPKPGSIRLSPNHSFILGLMNIDQSLYDVEMGFNEQKRMRYIRIKLKAALSIKFKFESGERSVALEKGDTILLLRIWHQSIHEMIANFEEIGLTLLQSSLTKDRQFLLTISGVDTKTED